MIKFKPPGNFQAHNIPKSYTPRKVNFKGGGTFFINGKEFIEYNDEFIEAVNKEKMWAALNV